MATFANVQGIDINLDTIRAFDFDDAGLLIKLDWTHSVNNLTFRYSDQGAYDTDKAAILAAIGGTAEGNVTISGDLTVVGKLYGVGQDSKNYRNVWNINLNATQDGPEDEAMGIAFTRITLASGTGTGSVNFDTFINLPAPFNRPPHVLGTYVGNVTPGTDPFSVIDVTTTAFSYDGQPDALVDIIVIGSESYVG